MQILDKMERLFNEKYTPEEERNPETIEKNRKKSFFSRVHQKFLAMTMAGFLTLGGGWEKSFADQLKIKTPEKKGDQIEFVLEAGITDEKIEAFRSKLEKEEPAVLTWLNIYKKLYTEQLNAMENEILNGTLGGEKDTDNESEMYKATDEELLRPQDVVQEVASDHEIVNILRKDPEKLKQYHQFITDNIDKIILSALMLQDSKDARKNLIQHTNAPVMNFKYHDTARLMWDFAAYMEPLPSDVMDQYRKGEIKKSDLPIKNSPAITMIPESFLGYSYNVSLKKYLESLIHESIHTIQFVSKPKDYKGKETHITTTIREGLTQHITFEILQYLAPKDPELGIKPHVGFSQKYDRRLLITSIMDSIFKTAENKTLTEWYYSMRHENKEFIKEFKDSLNKLGLDVKIAEDFNKFSNGRITEMDFLAILLGRLQLQKIELSKEFLNDILKKNRGIDDEIALDRVNKNIDYISEDAKNRAKWIKEARDLQNKE